VQAPVSASGSVPSRNIGLPQPGHFGGGKVAGGTRADVCSMGLLPRSAGQKLNLFHSAKISFVSGIQPLALA